MNIAVWNHKGGTGKTTIAVHIAAWIATQKARVLLVDADHQASALRWMSGHQALVEEGATWTVPDLPLVVAWLPHATLTQAVQLKQQHKADLLIIDCAPDGGAGERLGRLDLLLVPVAGRLSIEAAASVTAETKARRVALIPTMVEPGKGYYKADLEAMRAMSGPYVWEPVVLSSTVRRAEQQGKPAWAMPYGQTTEATRALEANALHVWKLYKKGMKNA